MNSSEEVLSSNASLHNKSKKYYGWDKTHMIVGPIV